MKKRRALYKKTHIYDLVFTEVRYRESLLYFLYFYHIYFLFQDYTSKLTWCVSVAIASARSATSPKV